MLLKLLILLSSIIRLPLTINLLEWFKSFFCCNGESLRGHLFCISFWHSNGIATSSLHLAYYLLIHSVKGFLIGLFSAPELWIQLSHQHFYPLPLLIWAVMDYPGLNNIRWNQHWDWLQSYQMCAALSEVTSVIGFFFSVCFKNYLSNSQDQKSMPLPIFESPAAWRPFL